MDEEIVERISTGIDGLDEMLNGGVPKGHVFAVLGTFGTGKTTFALQYIWEGASSGDKCIFISLEEEKDEIIKTSRSYGWDFEKYIDDGQIVIEKLSPADADATINKLKSDLPKFIEDFGADRIVIDSVSLLNMLSDKAREKRERLFELCQMVKKEKATTMLTAEVKDDNPTSSRDGLVEYTADGVIVLRYDQPHNQEVQMSIQVIKMRRIEHSRKIKPYEITDQGLNVQTEGAIF